MSIWCKICGITTVADAQAAQTAGADALGFNCYRPSRRFVPAETIGALTAAVEVTRVALFVDPSRAEVEEVLGVSEIDLLQFQGEEQPSFCASFGLPYMKAVRMREGVDVNGFAQKFGTAWALLLDTYVAGQPGGTGQPFDWQQWPDASARENMGPKLILAGGLTSSSVAAAIVALKPFGVDVAGGVEGVQKGLKDHQKMVKFVQEVRRAGA